MSCNHGNVRATMMPVIEGRSADSPNLRDWALVINTADELTIAKILKTCQAFAKAELCDGKLVPIVDCRVKDQRNILRGIISKSLGETCEVPHGMPFLVTGKTIKIDVTKEMVYDPRVEALKRDGAGVVDDENFVKAKQSIKAKMNIEKEILSKITIGVKLNKKEKYEIVCGQRAICEYLMKPLEIRSKLTIGSDAAPVMLAHLAVIDNALDYDVNVLQKGEIESVEQLASILNSLGEIKSKLHGHDDVSGFVLMYLAHAVNQIQLSFHSLLCRPLHSANPSSSALWSTRKILRSCTSVTDTLKAFRHFMEPLFKQAAMLCSNFGEATINGKFTVEDQLNSELMKVVTQHFPEALSLGLKIKVTSSSAGKGGKSKLTKANKKKQQKIQVGDFQSNSCMQFSRALNVKAEDFASKVGNLSNYSKSSSRLIEDVNFMPRPPFYINITLKREYIASRLMEILQSGEPLPPFQQTKKRVAVDFSSPNIAKEMHVGHLRSTIMGECISRVLEFCGHDVCRINHTGDWGTQFGMLITNLDDQFPDFTKDPPKLSDLNQFYKDSKKRFDAEPEFTDRAKKRVVSLQSGDKATLKGWKCLCDISRSMFKTIYGRLDVTTHEMGESFYNPFIPKVIDELLEKKLVKKEEGGGAIVGFLEGYKVPLMVRKSDGGFNYDSTDITCIKYRLQELDRNWLIYVTDLGQKLHFELFIGMAKLAGWAEEAHGSDGARVNHITFGVVQDKERKKFATRSGKTVKLAMLLDEAADRAYLRLKERQDQGKCSLTEEEMRNSARIIGFSAVKYFDMKNHRDRNYVYDDDAMLSPDGDTAVYLHFAQCRIKSIVDKASFNAKEAIKNWDEGKMMEYLLSALKHPSEVNLAKLLLQFQKMIRSFLEDLTPHKICNYLYDVSCAVSVFVRDCRVLNSPEGNEAGRVLLCHATVLVMRKCMRLLGLEPLDRI